MHPADVLLLWLIQRGKVMKHCTIAFGGHAGRGRGGGGGGVEAIDLDLHVACSTASEGNQE